MIAVVLNLVLLAMDNKIRGKVSFDIGRLLIIILISIVLSIMIIERAELMGYIYFSDLEKGNPIAVASMNNAVVSWVFYGLVLLISVVGGFLKVKKD
jgi:fumarate reductase subunit D